MAVYDRAVAAVDEAQRYALFLAYIRKAEEAYGAPRTRISEVWVPGRPQKAPEPQTPSNFARPFGPKTAAVEIVLTPAVTRRARPRRRWTDRLARLDRPLDPFYAKALIDMFLL
jgi:hypothetical protein